MNRTICVVTGSRAEYGLLRWLMEAIRDDSTLDLQVVVTGSHLEPALGETWQEIESDGFSSDARIPLGLGGDLPCDIAAAMGRATAGMGEALARLKPDLVVVLGDRYEILAAVLACQPARVPIAHIHGGELTEGAMDDAFRHAITKLSHLHFAAAEEYARRIVQMGEEPARVFNVGSLGVEAVERTDYLDRDALEADLGHPLDGPLLLVTSHPETLSSGDPAAGTQALLAALEHLPRARVVFTGVNADPGRQAVDTLVRAFVAARPDRASHHDSLGQRRYLSLMRLADAVLGNSSSGIYEAPAMAVPTVNIGARQAGRLRGPSVIDCPDDSNAVAEAVGRVLEPSFRRGLSGADSPYGAGGAAARMVAELKAADLDGLSMKRFHDLPAAA